MRTVRYFECLICCHEWSAYSQESDCPRCGSHGKIRGIKGTPSPADEDLDDTLSRV